MKKILAALMISALLVLGFQAPAMASWNDCANYPGTICLWQHGDFTGQVWRQYPTQVFGCRSFVPDNFNDKASAAYNQASGHYQVRFWQHANCTGSYLTLGSGQWRVFTGNLADFNDQASAVEVIAL